MGERRLGAFEEGGIGLGSDSLALGVGAVTPPHPWLSLWVCHSVCFSFLSLPCSFSAQLAISITSLILTLASAFLGTAPLTKERLDRYSSLPLDASSREALSPAAFPVF